MTCLLPLLLLARVGAAPIPETQTLQRADRVTFPASRSEGWTVLPLAEQGLLLIGEAGEGWQATRYDAAFTPLWTVPVPAGVEGDPVEVRRQDDDAWVLFQKGKVGALVGLALEDGAARALPLEFPRAARSVMGFEVLDDEAWIATTTTGWGGTRGTLLSVDLHDGATVELAAPVDAKSASLQRLSLDPGREVVDVVYHTTRKRRRTQHIAVASNAGLTPDLELAWPDGNLLTIQRRRLEDGTQLLVGTYADEPKGQLSQGLYLARVDASGRVGEIVRHSFTSLSHFFDYLPERRQARISEKAEKKAEKGKELDLDVLFDVHHVREEGDLIVVSGEAYQPVFVTQSRTVTQTVNGVTTTRVETTQVFVGWSFSHFAAAAFRTDGTVAWDVSIPIGNVVSAKIEPHVDTSYHDGELTLIYTARRKAYTRTFRDGTLVEDRSKLDLTSPEDDTRGALGSVVPWQAGEFLAWGYQKTRDEGKIFALERITHAE